MEQDLYKSLEPNEPDVSRKTGWITSVLEDCEREGVVLHRSIIIRNRELIFKLSENLGYGLLGIPGHTCRILEQYLISILDSGKRIEDVQLRRQYYMQKVMSRILLIMVCSMQLASKTTADRPGLRVSKVRAILMCYNYYYSPEEIKETEMEIFTVLDYHVPKWNSVDITGLLTNEVSKDLRDFAAAIYFMHLTELNRNTIEVHLISIAELETDFLKDETILPLQLRSVTVSYQNCIRAAWWILAPTLFSINEDGRPMLSSGQAVTLLINNSRVRTLHLAAGCVAAALKLNKPESDPIPILAKLVLVPSLYIQCIRDVVFKVAILSCKR